MSIPWLTFVFDSTSVIVEPTGVYRGNDVAEEVTLRNYNRRQHVMLYDVADEVAILYDTVRCRGKE